MDRLTQIVKLPTATLQEAAELNRESIEDLMTEANSLAAITVVSKEFELAWSDVEDMLGWVKTLTLESWGSDIVILSDEEADSLYYALLQRIMRESSIDVRMVFIKAIMLPEEKGYVLVAPSSRPRAGSVVIPALA